MTDARPAEQDDRRRRGGAGPRSWQAAQREAEQAILDATLRMLGTQGVAGTTIEGVAADAGVGKTTIYRRWPTKTDLILAPSDLVPRATRRTPAAWRGHGGRRRRSGGGSPARGWPASSRACSPSR